MSQPQQMSLELSILPSSFAVCKLGCDDLARSSSELSEGGDRDRGQLARWLVTETLAPHVAGDFFSITHTKDEVSIVCMESRLPPSLKHLLRIEAQYRALKVKGPLDFALVGILANLTTALAAKAISVFAMSTYDTDYLFVKDDRLPQAIVALQAAGHLLRTEPISVTPATVITPSPSPSAALTAAAKKMINNYQGMSGSAFPDDGASFGALGAAANISGGISAVYGAGPVHLPHHGTHMHHSMSDNHMVASRGRSNSAGGASGMHTAAASSIMSPRLVPPALVTRTSSGSISSTSTPTHTTTPAAALAGGLYTAMPSDTLAPLPLPSPSPHFIHQHSASSILSPHAPSRTASTPVTGSFYTSTIGHDDFAGGGIISAASTTTSPHAGVAPPVAVGRVTTPPYTTGPSSSPPPPTAVSRVPLHMAAATAPGGLYSATIGGADFADTFMRSPSAPNTTLATNPPATPSIPSTTSLASLSHTTPVPLHHSVSSPLPHLPSATAPPSSTGPIHGRYHGSLTGGTTLAATAAAIPPPSLPGAHTPINAAAARNYGAFGSSSDWADTHTNTTATTPGTTSPPPAAHPPLVASSSAPLPLSAATTAPASSPTHATSLPSVSTAPVMSQLPSVAPNSNTGKKGDARYFGPLATTDFPSAMILQQHANTAAAPTPTMTPLPAVATPAQPPPPAASPIAPYDTGAAVIEAMARQRSTDNVNPYNTGADVIAAATPATPSAPAIAAPGSNGGIGHGYTDLVSEIRTSSPPHHSAATASSGGGNKAPFVLVLETLSCYRSCDREEAKNLLRDTPAGTYLVRKSTEGYVLSYSIPPKANHVIIYRFPEGLCLRREGTSTMHRSIEALVRSAIGDRARPIS